jgi:hypothetical protein
VVQCLCIENQARFYRTLKNAAPFTMGTLYWQARFVFGGEGE